MDFFTIHIKNQRGEFCGLLKPKEIINYLVDVYFPQFVFKDILTSSIIEDLGILLKKNLHVREILVPTNIIPCTLETLLYNLSNIKKEEPKFIHDKKYKFDFPDKVNIYNLAKVIQETLELRKTLISANYKLCHNKISNLNANKISIEVSQEARRITSNSQRKSVYKKSMLYGLFKDIHDIYWIEEKSAEQSKLRDSWDKYKNEKGWSF